MPYFDDNYARLSFPVLTPLAGLYNAQLGAIHAIAAHFTVHDQPALVTMPTGSGKTAVLMMTPFVLRSTRVLVITPSRMVREQIAEDFGGLVTLRRAGAIPDQVRSPRVREVKARIENNDGWEGLREFEVVISTPNCTSPTYANIPEPPGDLFDLVLIDEAHHSSAETWAELLDAFPHSKKVLFTATPFRRDRAEIEARFVYTYPVDKAFREGIFGRIRYVPVEADQVNSDVLVAQATELTFAADRQAGLNHFVMVRTDTLTRANALVDVYGQHTALNLALIHSRISNTRVKQVLARLDEGALDGIICVNMLGEGFNFPRLKIAAIHSPHKSLEVTLQFIGRFARTNAPDIGEAKFIAVRSEIEVEGERLFTDNAVWQDIIVDLAYGRIEEEIAVREALDAFVRPRADDPDLSDLSLYSLHPRSHVKIYDTTDVVVDLAQPIRIGSDWHERYRNLTEARDVLVDVYRQLDTPPWSSTDMVLDSIHVLLVVYHDTERRLLFVNSSDSANGIYDAVVNTVAPEANRLSLSQVRRVVRRLRDQHVFNYGMRTMHAANASESYRISSGPNASATLSPLEARLYRQGHAFVTGDVDGEKQTIGYSSGSKVWSAQTHRIPGLLRWCRTIGQEIRNDAAVVTNSGLDYLPTGAVVADLPPNIVLAQWSPVVFDLIDPPRAEYLGDDGAGYRPLLMDLELSIDRQHSTQRILALRVGGRELNYGVRFNLEIGDGGFYEPAPGSDLDRISVVTGRERQSLVAFMNEYYLDLYTADGGVMVGNELSVPLVNAEPIDRQQLEVWNWEGVDIEREVVAPAGHLSIHDRVRAHLAPGILGVVFCDHGSGEIADFVSVNRQDDRVSFVLYHCKGSGGPAPGARVSDVYEVCGQAQKSVIWRSLGQLRRRIDRRIEDLDYVRGGADDLADLLEASEGLRQEFGVVVVQPGISFSGITAPLLENLGATSAHLSRSGFQRLRVIVSD